MLAKRFEPKRIIPLSRKGRKTFIAGFWKYRVIAGKMVASECKIMPSRLVIFNEKIIKYKVLERYLYEESPDCLSIYQKLI